MGKQRTVPLVANGACEASEACRDQTIPLVEFKLSKSCRKYFTHVRNFDRCLLCLTLRGWAGAPLRYAAMLFEFY